MTGFSWELSAPKLWQELYVATLRRLCIQDGVLSMSQPHNKFLQSDQITLSRLLRAQQACQHALAAEERRYVPFHLGEVESVDG